MITKGGSMPHKLIEESKPIAEINIIPFVDIILVILIIFMVTAPFIIKTGFSLDLPQADSAEEVQEAVFNITIAVDGRILLNGEVLDLEQLKMALSAEDIETDKSRVIISADKNVLHGKVISIINTAKSAGLTKVAIATKREDKTPE